MQRGELAGSEPDIRGEANLSGGDVFLSYSSEDRDAARAFAERLADEGFSVWWDAALRAGETFDEVIEKALRAAKSVIVLWSPRSVASRWVRAEATLADRANKLIPVIIEQCDRPIIFELTHTTDLSKWNGSTEDRAWRNMIQDLSRLVNAGEADPLVANNGLRSSQQRAVPGVREDDQIRIRARTSEAPAGAEPRKLNNRIFAPLGLVERRSVDDPDDGDGDESTRFYTASHAYGDDWVHCLELTIGERVEKRFVVSPSGLKIGRAAPADVILSDSRISRTHCLVQLGDGGLSVSDLNSTNGTFVDGERIAGPRSLPVGSVLKIGNISFRHELRTSADI